jgi:hypothetical protein
MEMSPHNNVPCITTVAAYQAPQVPVHHTVTQQRMVLCPSLRVSVLMVIIIPLQQHLRHGVQNAAYLTIVIIRRIHHLYVPHQVAH